ncbi:Transmembrane channel-like protein 7-like 3 [Homarus americanus]|uniref:Transmembrane channel-like protein 7-like 3 n=1 Tax=Homarus americanus TaxID=6706 RepID=A0A8J5NAQ5_HOMAM|nr:Transmembrane channel-like protein 7-like 3 [Homarus americanus]
MRLSKLRRLASFLPSPAPSLTSHRNTSTCPGYLTTTLLPCDTVVTLNQDNPTCAHPSPHYQQHPRPAGTCHHLFQDNTPPPMGVTLLHPHFSESRSWVRREGLTVNTLTSHYNLGWKKHLMKAKKTTRPTVWTTTRRDTQADVDGEEREETVSPSPCPHPTCTSYPEGKTSDVTDDLKRVKGLEMPLCRKLQQLKRLRQIKKVPGVLLRQINAHFGASGVAVFHLIRDLIILNLVISVVLCISLVLPTLYQLLVLEDTSVVTAGWTTTNTSTSSTDTHHHCPLVLPTYDDPKVRNCSLIYLDSLAAELNNTWSSEATWWVSQLLSGKGCLEYSPLFLGFYPVLLLGDTYSVAAVQVLAVMTVFLVSLVTVVTRIGQWLRYNSAFWGGLTFSKMVLMNWDFSLQREQCVMNKKRLLLNEIRAAFDEDEFQRAKCERTRSQVVGLFIKRFVVNCVILAVLLVGCIIIILVTNYRSILEDWVDKLDLQEIWQQETLESVISYLDTLTVWLLGLLLPSLISSLGSLEQYSSRITMLLFILRNISIRLISLGVLVVSHLIYVTSNLSDDCRLDIPCWETALAQKLYAQIVWDFAMRVIVTVLLLAYRLLTLPFSCLKISLLPEFDVPGRVLDVLFLQTICWLSVPVSPLLPVLVLVSLYLLLWMDVVGALITTKPSSHVFQVSRSSAMFMVVLAVSWVWAAILTITVFVFIPPSLSCGPFRGLQTAWDALTYNICSLGARMRWLREMLFMLSNVIVTGSVGAVLVVAILYYFWVLEFRSGAIKRLENKLKGISQDKIFLMEMLQKFRGNRQPPGTDTRWRRGCQR